MANYLRRLILAFCLSAACYYATEDWYRRTNVSIASTGRQEPIALLQDLTNEVQRKPLTRVIWETISKDENLFAGEAIRTSDDSEAKIMFLKSGTVIELEPDSLVVLEETDSGLSLDFLKGNLFVKTAGQGAPGSELTLKSGKSEINLQNADISLSKKGQSDSVDVQVYGGTAQVKQGEKTVTLDKDKSGTLSQQGMDVTKTQIKVLSPFLVILSTSIQNAESRCSFSGKNSLPTTACLLSVAAAETVWFAAERDSPLATKVNLPSLQ